MNRGAVLAEVLRSRPVSRKLVASRTGISAATVTRAVDSLIAEGILREGDELVVESRGRRAVPLDLVADRSYVAGIDLGASNMRYIVSDLLANPIAAGEIVTPRDLGATQLAHWVAEELRRLRADAWPPITEVSLGLPGAVSATGDMVSNAPNLEVVEDPEFLSSLVGALGVDVQIDNDANFALLGEQRFGAARNMPMAGMLTLGAGLGAGLSINGQILRGKHGLVGEFGQLPVGPLGTRLEHLVTGPGIMRRAAEAGVVFATPADLFTDDAVGSVAALRTHFDHALLIVLTAIAVSSEPEVIVLGGGISNSLLGSLSRYEDSLRQNLRVAPRLTLAELGDYSGAAGAIVSSLQAVYSKLGVDALALADLPAAHSLNAQTIAAVHNSPAVPR